MNLQSLFAKIMGFVVIIVTLALAPSIATANTAITGWTGTAPTANITQFMGMSVVGSFGAPLIILGLLIGGGLFAVAGVRGKMGAVGMKDMMAVVGSVIVVIVCLSLFTSILDYTHTLIGSGTGFAETIYAIIPLLIYIGIIAAAGWVTVSTYRKTRKGGKKSRAAVANF